MKPPHGYDASTIEARWQRTWQEERAFEVGSVPSRPKWFIVELPPFATGQLHMGHARNYVLADACARFRRMLGHDVLYTSGFDTFGLPTELAALAAGRSPRELAESCAQAMGDQLVKLGLGHDRRRFTSYHVPEFYRWVQWVFVRLFKAGHCFRRDGVVHWCPSCEITLAASLVDNGACWRCGTQAQLRSLPQWFVRETDFADEMLAGMDRLDGWPETVKLIHKDWIGRVARDDGTGFDYRLQDWNIARARYWGPPVPIVHCAACGAVPVDEADLPVRLPDDVHLTGRGNPLESHAGFLHTHCPQCGGEARRDTETLEAYSSPWWYHWICRSLGSDNPFDADDARNWLPVDLMIGGSDQVRSCFFHVRMIARALRRMGVTEIEEPVDQLVALGMVKHDNRKMSKSAGNAVDLDTTIARYGADALRLAILGAAAPERDFNWSDDLVRKQHAFLARLWRFVHEVAQSATAVADAGRDAPGTQALRRKLDTWVDAAGRRITSNFERNAWHLAVRNTEFLFGRLEAARELIDKAGRGSASDMQALHEATRAFVLFLAPLAPHIAEELWQVLQGQGLAAAAPWPARATADEPQQAEEAFA